MRPGILVPKSIQVGLALAAVVVAGACGSEPADEAIPPSASGPLVVATTSIWADVVSNVACDGSASIVTMVPLGGDPHGYEPSLADRSILDESALVVANGLGLEAGLDDTLVTAEASGASVFRFADHVETIPLSVNGDSEGGNDPHIWFDPIRVSAALPALADRLIADVGLDPDTIEGCLVAYQTELHQLDESLQAEVAAIDPPPQLVTNHDSLGYLADRYGLEVIGTVIPAPSTLAETNPARLEELAIIIEAAGVEAIFAESQHSADDVEALASRVGSIEVVTLLTGTLGQPGSEAETYTKLLRSTVHRISDALGSNV